MTRPDQDSRSREHLLTYLGALYSLDSDGFIEIAHRYESRDSQGPMRRGRTGLFRSATDLQAVAREIEQLARERHVWLGVVPRRPHPDTGELGGTKEHTAPARVLWVDCDSGDRQFPLERLRAFRPQPHMIVSSGGGYHAYWLLKQPVEDPEWLRKANERLATMLGGDLQSADAARILRPPGTLNFKAKYGSPRPVELVFAAAHPRVRVHELVGVLPRQIAHRRKARKPEEARTADPLRQIAPRHYFAQLAGSEPGRDGKVCCPLASHADPGPSCHVYESAGEGWYCFGCGRGGDIYELAGELWGLRREGREFLELRELLATRFGIEAATARTPVLRTTAQ